jgi:hypothetical protein
MDQPDFPSPIQNSPASLSWRLTMRRANWNSSPSPAGRKVPSEHLAHSLRVIEQLRSAALGEKGKPKSIV